MKKRTIKYRAKRKRDGVWVYGLEKPKKSNEITLGQFFNQVADGILDRYTLGQYTGLKDKKGVEIYGGDCFSINNRETGTRIGMAWVVWDENELGFRLTDNMKCGEKNIHWFAKNREVIGNKYDNKNLLK